MDRPRIEFQRAIANLRRLWWIVALAAALGLGGGLFTVVRSPSANTTAQTTVELAPEPGVALLAQLTGGNATLSLPLNSLLKDLTDDTTARSLGTAVSGSTVDASVSSASANSGDRLVVDVRVSADSESKAHRGLAAYIGRFRKMLRAAQTAIAEDAAAILAKATNATTGASTSITGTDLGLARAMVDQLRGYDSVARVTNETLSAPTSSAVLPVLLTFAFAVLAAGLIVMASPFDRRLYTVTDIERVAGVGLATTGVVDPDDPRELALVVAELARGDQRVELLPVGVGTVDSLSEALANALESTGGDGPQPVPSSRAASSTSGHATMLVVAAGRDREQDLNRALRMYRATGRALVGIVLVGARATGAGWR